MVKTRSTTGRSGQNRWGDSWPPTGRISGRPRGVPVAAYGENLMATHIRMPPRPPDRMRSRPRRGRSARFGKERTAAASLVPRRGWYWCGPVTTSPRKQQRMDGGAKAGLRPRRCGADPADCPLARCQLWALRAAELGQSDPGRRSRRGQDCRSEPRPPRPRTPRTPCRSACAGRYRCRGDGVLDEDRCDGGGSGEG